MSAATVAPLHADVLAAMVEIARRPETADRILVILDGRHRAVDDLTELAVHRAND